MQVPRPLPQRPLHSSGDSDADILRVPEQNGGGDMEQEEQKLSTLGIQAPKYQAAGDLSSELFKELSEVQPTTHRRLQPFGSRRLSNLDYNSSENHRCEYILQVWGRRKSVCRGLSTHCESQWPQISRQSGRGRDIQV